MAESAEQLTVAVTGPTGTFGFGLIPRLEADERIGQIVGIARRPFDPAEHGWTKLDYRRGDVRDQDALAEAFAGSDVVVHLAFIIVGRGSRETIREVNVEGTLNAVRAAAAAGAKRFVYASSVAAYGFHRDNPVGMTEEWPARPADHLFYAQEKAEIEHALTEEAAAQDLDLYLLRPPVVLGPNAMGAKDLLPERVGEVGAAVVRRLRRSRVPIPVPMPDLPVQFIHEEDVGQAFHLCIVAAGPPGTYNIAGDGVLSAHDVVRELGLHPVPFPAGPIKAGARALAGLSLAPPQLEWAEAISQPAIMDSSKAKEELGWSPEYDSLAALRATLPDAD